MQQISRLPVYPGRDTNGMRLKFDSGALVLIFLFLSIQLSTHPVHAQFSQDEIEFTAYIIMPETLLYKIMNGEYDYTLVDVRPEEEYRASHIIGAVSLPWDDGTFMERRNELPRNKAVILISQDGLKGLKALKVLLQDEYDAQHQSYREVLSIEGGMDNWPYGDYLVHD
jgi:rhodanese-related sulfurtransferase